MPDENTIQYESTQLFLGLKPVFLDVNFYNNSYQKIKRFFDLNGYKDILSEKIDWIKGKHGHEPFCNYEVLDCSHQTKQYNVSGLKFTENDLTYYSGDSCELTIRYLNYICIQLFFNLNSSCFLFHTKFQAN